MALVQSNVKTLSNLIKYEEFRHGNGGGSMESFQREVALCNNRLWDYLTLDGNSAGDVPTTLVSIGDVMIFDDTLFSGAGGFRHLERTVDDAAINNGDAILKVCVDDLGDQRRPVLDFESDAPRITILEAGRAVLVGFQTATLRPHTGQEVIGRYNMTFGNYDLAQAGDVTIVNAALDIIRADDIQVLQGRGLEEWIAVQDADYVVPERITKALIPTNRLG